MVSGDAPKLLLAIEQTFDEIAFPIKRLVEIALVAFVSAVRIGGANIFLVQVLP